jgi:hypothetical protein
MCSPVSADAEEEPTLTWKTVAELSTEEGCDFHTEHAFKRQAGRLIFTDSDHSTLPSALHAVNGGEENSVPGLQLLPMPLSGFDDVKRAPHSHNLAVR